MPAIEIISFDKSAQFCEQLQRIDSEVFAEIKMSAVDLLSYLKQSPNYRVFMAKFIGEPAGYMGLLNADTLHYRGLWVDLLATRPAFENQGVASALLDFALNLAKAEGLDCVSAIVRPSNLRSQAVFQKQGFTPSPEAYSLLMKTL